MQHSSSMVRFHWHVEDGFGAFIPPCGMVPVKDTKVQTAIVEIEVRTFREGIIVDTWGTHSITAVHAAVRQTQASDLTPSSLLAVPYHCRHCYPVQRPAPAD